MNYHQITKELLQINYARRCHFSIPLLISLNRNLRGNEDLIRKILSFIKRGVYYYEDIEPILEPIIDIGNNILIRNNNEFDIILPFFTNDDFKILYEVLIQVLNEFNDLIYMNISIDNEKQSFTIKEKNKYINRYRYFIVNYQNGRRRGSRLNKGHITFSLKIQR